MILHLQTKFDYFFKSTTWFGSDPCWNVCTEVFKPNDVAFIITKVWRDRDQCLHLYAPLKPELDREQDLELKQPGSVVVQHGIGTLRLRLQCSEVHNCGAVPPLSPLLLPSGGQQIHAAARATAVADPHVEVLAKALETTFMVVLNHEHLQARYVWSNGLVVTAYHYKYAPSARDMLVSPSHGTKNFSVMCYGSSTRHDAVFCGAWLADEVVVLQVGESLTVRPLPQGSTGEMGRNGIVCAWHPEV